MSIAKIDFKIYLKPQFTKNTEYSTGFELSISEKQNAIYFAIITMPKKSHFTIFIIQNFVQNTKKYVNPFIFLTH